MMAQLLSRLLLVSTVALAGVGPARAQNVPVVLVHGIGSNAGTWDSTADRLSQEFAVDVYRRDTNSFASYEAQASEINQSFGFLPGSTVAVGHSNGGLVSRVWSTSHPLAGLVTVGSPNSGAPLVTNLYNVGWYVADTARSVWDALNRAIDCNYGWCTGGNYGFIYPDLLSAGVLDLHDVMWSAFYTVLFSIMPGGDVVSEMFPSSAFLNDVNSSGHLAAETGNVGMRIGVTSVAHEFYAGGIFRASFPDQADWITWARDAAAATFTGYAWHVFATADPNDQGAWDLAWSLYTAGARLYDLDHVWCMNVSQPWYYGSYGQCWENDTIVPTWSQELPWRQLQLQVSDGPAHTQETASNEGTYDKVRQVLDEFLHIPLHGSSSGPPSSSMQENAAIRGCSNYIEWSPVFQPGAAECLAYCSSHEADSCEWHVSGNCYVEFGAGCYVQSGFSGWYAGVIH